MLSNFGIRDQEALEHFASLCHQLWQQEKAQGNRQGKGFRHSLRNAGINVNRAYRTLRKFFPADFPVQPKKLKNDKTATSFAAIEVDPTAVSSTGELFEGYEVLECKFALTPEDKAEFFEALKFVDRSQLWPLLLDAVKQAASQAQSLPGPPARADLDRARDRVAALSGSLHDAIAEPSRILQNRRLYQTKTRTTP